MVILIALKSVRFSEGLLYDSNGHDKMMAESKREWDVFALSGNKKEWRHGHVQWMVTQNESEALLLKHRPWKMAQSGLVTSCSENQSPKTSKWRHVCSR